jgi:hypothetical protein
MPISWDVESDRRLVRLRYAGAVSPTEWRAAIDALVADPRHASGFAWLVDRRAADPPSVELAQAIVIHLQHRIDRLGEHFRVALLVNRSSTEFGMARMQASLNEVLGVETLIFYEEEAAIAWLVEGQPPLPAKAPDGRVLGRRGAERRSDIPNGRWAREGARPCITDSLRY